MYRAKAEGKGRYDVFEPGMHVAVMERLELEADLQRAVERDELILHYQPVIDLASGEIRGIEALVRWRHPARGLVPPDSFIPLAEETRLMPQLGRWVLNEACRQGARWLSVAAALRALLRGRQPLGPPATVARAWSRTSRRRSSARGSSRTGSSSRSPRPCS